MDLKLDPHAASLMAGELATDHASYLRGRVGRDPTSGELYAAHFLGPQGSARLIEAYQSNPRVSAAALFPDAAAANHSIFYKDGRAATVAEVYGRPHPHRRHGDRNHQPARPRRLRAIRLGPTHGAGGGAAGADGPGAAGAHGRFGRPAEPGRIAVLGPRC